MLGGNQEKEYQIQLKMPKTNRKRNKTKIAYTM